LPFKANADRRRHIPRRRHRVTNWAEYDAGLRARGSLTVRFTAEAIEAWRAEPRTGRGGQPRYSALAITTALTLRAVFRLALRQTEGLIGSILALLGLDLAVPDHSTLSRRAETLRVRGPRRGCDLVHLLVDSTGLKLCEPGEWLVEKHGTKRRRSWRKLHLATDADTGRIVASALTDKDAEDGSRTGRLLDRIDGPIASFTADGAFDRDDVYAEVAARHPDAAVVVPPRSNAVPSEAAETAPTRAGTRIYDASPSAAAWDGRRSRDATGAPWWSPTSRDGNASSATACAHERMDGSGPRWRSPPTCSTACSTSDVRSMSASHDVEHGSEVMRLHRRSMQHSDLYPEVFEGAPADPHAAGTLAAVDQTKFLDRRDAAATSSGRQTRPSAARPEPRLRYSRGSVRLGGDPGGGDHPPPALQVFRQEGRELLRRGAGDDGAERPQALVGFGLGEGGAQRRVQAPDDRLGRPRRRQEAEALGVLLEAGEARLGHGRHLGEVRVALRRRDRQRAELAFREVVRDPTIG
jgi:hypothetical protein